MVAVAAPVLSGAPTALAATGLRSRLWSSGLRRILRESKAHGLWIAGWSVVGWVGTALAPVLTDHPFVLMMLSPRALFAALATDSVGLLVFVIFGTARLGVTDASHYLIGRRLPEVFRAPEQRRTSPLTSAWRRRVAWVTKRSDRLCRRLAARPALASTVLFFRPNGKFLAAAGAYGVSPVVAGASSMLGTACFLAALHLGVGAIF